MRASISLKIIAVLMTALAIFMTASCSVKEILNIEEATTERPAVPLEVKPETEAEILDFYNRAANAIKVQKPGVTSTCRASVKDVDAGGNDDVVALIEFAKLFSEALEKTEETKEYGADLNDLFPIKGSGNVSLLTPDDIKTAAIEDVEDDQYSYDLHIVLNDSDEYGPASRAFDFESDKENILMQFDDYSDLITVQDYTVEYNGCEINARINKETNRVTNLCLIKNCIVTPKFEFTGTLADLGDAPITFRLELKQELHDFVWDDPSKTTTAAS